ncbi:MAG: hypothetical protein RL219_1261 [Actinomycetota bacterium]
MSSTPEQPSTRDVIVVEALRCFAEAGYEGTSLNDIAAAVGIRRPSLLHHFASKEDLYGEVFERILSDFVGPIEDAAAGTESGWDRVERVLSTAFAVCASNPDHVRLLRREAIDGGTHLGMDLAAALRPMFEGAVDFLRTEMSAGRFREHDPIELLVTGYGALLTSFSDTAFLAGLVDGDPGSGEALERRLDHLLGFFKNALVVRES